MLLALTTLLGCCIDQQIWSADGVFFEDLPTRPLTLELQHTPSATPIWLCDADEDGLPQDCGLVAQDGATWSVSLRDAPQDTTLRVWEQDALLLEEALRWQQIEAQDPGVCGVDLSWKEARVDLSGI